MPDGVKCARLCGFGINASGFRVRGLQLRGVEVWESSVSFAEVRLKPRLLDPLKTPPDFGQQKTRLCAWFGWYGHQILVWPIAALPNDLSANQ